jgi:hypothetical protein
MKTRRRPGDAAVLAVLGSDTGAAADADRRVADRLGVEPYEIHAQLSRLFDAGHVRLVRREGVMTYEVRTSPAP